MLVAFIETEEEVVIEFKFDGKRFEKGLPCDKDYLSLIWDNPMINYANNQPIHIYDEVTLKYSKTISINPSRLSKLRKM